MKKREREKYVGLLSGSVFRDLICSSEVNFIDLRGLREIIDLVASVCPSIPLSVDTVMPVIRGLMGIIPHEQSICF